MRNRKRGLAQDFKKDNEHLVELAIALQLFEKISSYVEINEQKAVRKAILEIAQEHGIEFLEKLGNSIVKAILLSPELKDNRSNKIKSFAP